MGGASTAPTALTSRRAMRRRRARHGRGRVLVATARELPTLLAAGVELDALVASGTRRRALQGRRSRSPAEARRLDVRFARRLGAAGRPVAPGPYEDTYGAGDCFAAGLTYALAKGMETVHVSRSRRARALTRPRRRSQADQPKRPTGPRLAGSAPAVVLPPRTRRAPAWVAERGTGPLLGLAPAATAPRRRAAPRPSRGPAPARLDPTR